ncbi:MAG: PAS domain S-box protein [Bdellovibrionales bacterium]|nr:PAS domain S-box protein [Bdellovibrionales bacterium]
MSAEGSYWLGKIGLQNWTGIHWALVLAIVVGSASLSYWLSQTLKRPIDILKIRIQKLAHDDLSASGDTARIIHREVHELALAVDEIAEHLDRRIKKITSRKQQQEAVFSSMAEGVMAVNSDRNIKFLNSAAAKILGIPNERQKGQGIEAVVRVPEIQDFVNLSLKADHPLEKEVELLGATSKHLQLRSSPLKSHDGTRNGTVLVFSDISRLKELESHRRDFVANVSHELRTPLTSIQGFAETLLTAEITDPEERRRFIKIIHRHAARLGSIIEDLLALSRIERGTEGQAIELSKMDVRSTVRSAIEMCEDRAQGLDIEIDCECEDEAVAAINAPLLEQAVVNLIDNAIKYSERGKHILVKVVPSPQDVRIIVLDHGIGITRKHLPRLFERFYRVDKARSRERGGTGLGLSIVKHVCLAHRGQVDVQSEPGKGSTFTIVLPTPH